MKDLLKLGETLTRKQQQEIKGGRRPVGLSDGQCTPGGSCNPYGDGSECGDLDHYCAGTNYTIIGGEIYYTGGICACD